MSTALDPFYLIVDHTRWLERLLPHGVKLVQLRIKDVDTETWRQQIRHAKAMCDEAGAVLVVNDAWQLAIEEGCQYVHLGQEDLAQADVQAIRDAGLSLGISTHSHDELDIALRAEPDYIALGPIYPTRLKAMPWAPQGTANIRDWKRRIGGIPLVAIGGLTVERADSALAAGADILSVVTDVSRHPDPESRVRQWLAATR